MPTKNEWQIAFDVAFPDIAGDVAEKAENVLEIMFDSKLPVPVMENLGKYIEITFTIHGIGLVSARIFNNGDVAVELSMGVAGKDVQAVRDFLTALNNPVEVKEIKPQHKDKPNDRAKGKASKHSK